MCKSAPQYPKNSKEDVPLLHYLEKYRQLNPQEASRRTGVPYDGASGQFRLRMLGRDYLISHPEFVVRQDGSSAGIAAGQDAATAGTVAGQGFASERILSSPAKILAIRYLLHGIGQASTGRFLTYREMPSGDVYDRQFSGRCLARLARAFGKNPGRVRDAMDAIGAKRLKNGDASCELEVFPGYLVRVIFWAGDEEFSPNAQMLFSDNFPISFVAEDLAVIGDLCASILSS